MPDFDELAALPLFSNSLLSWSISGAIALATFLLLLLIRRWIRSYYRRVQATPQTELLEIPVQVLSRRYMDVQQAINLRLHRDLAALGVEFAYPTQRLIIGAFSPPDSGQVSQAARSAA